MFVAMVLTVVFVAMVLMPCRFYSQTFNGRPGFAMGHRCSSRDAIARTFSHCLPKVGVTLQLEHRTAHEERCSGGHTRNDGAFTQIQQA